MKENNSTEFAEFHRPNLTQKTDCQDFANCWTILVLGEGADCKPLSRERRQFMKDSVVVEKGAGKAKKSQQRAQILPQKNALNI